MGNFASQWTEELHENDVARFFFDFCHLGYLWLMFVGIPVLGSPLAPTFTGEQLGGTPQHVDGGTPPGEQLGLSPSHDVGTVDLHKSKSKDHNSLRVLGRREEAEQLFGIWKLQVTNHHRQHQISREVVATQICFCNVHPDLGKIRFPF